MEVVIKDLEEETEEDQTEGTKDMVEGVVEVVAEEVEAFSDISQAQQTNIHLGVVFCICLYLSIPYAKTIHKQVREICFPFSESLCCFWF